MTHAILSTTSHTAIIDAVKSEQGNQRKWLKVVDSLHADGIRSNMITTEKKGGNVEAREAVRNAVIAGFTAKDQALLAKESKTLEDSEKVEKRYIQQQVGSMLGHIERLLTKAEKKAEPDAPSIAKTKWTRFQDQLDAMISAIQDAEGVAGLNATDALRVLKTAKGYMPKA